MPRAYQWNDAKNRENIAKHGIDFADAHRIFERPMLVRLDDRQDYGEQRGSPWGTSMASWSCWSSRIATTASA